MFSKRRIFRFCVALPLATAVACERGAEQLVAGDRLSVPPQPQLDVAATVLNVADVEQLYAAVNDPANEGAAIILAPGTYVLSALTAAGVARPNAGRLELQQDMSTFTIPVSPAVRAFAVEKATKMSPELFSPLPPMRPTPSDARVTNRLS